MDDIIDMFKALDSVKDQETPWFMCDDASKLPPSRPEAAGSMMVVMENMPSQQRQIQQMQENMCSMRLDLEKVCKSVDNNQTTITSLTQSVEDLKLKPARVHSDQGIHPVVSSGGEQNSTNES